MTTEYFALMSRYNGWMNEKLFAACDAMPDEMRRADRGAFFRSIHGTFNHILLCDRLWLGRFSGRPFAVKSLDEELVADWEELKAERQKTDAAINTWLETLSDEQLKEPLMFTSISQPAQHTAVLWMLLAHFFNHQTHHRGQITTLMEQMGYDSGVTDLPMMPGVRFE